MGGEKMNGISSLDEVKALLDQAENDFPALLARLEGLRETILNANTCRDGMILDITGDAAVLEKIEPSVEKFLNELPGDSGGSAGNCRNFTLRPTPGRSKPKRKWHLWPPSQTRASLSRRRFHTSGREEGCTMLARRSAAPPL